MKYDWVVYMWFDPPRLYYTGQATRCQAEREAFLHPFRPLSVSGFRQGAHLGLCIGLQ
jgi:hypothetical protein